MLVGNFGDGTINAFVRRDGKILQGRSLGVDGGSVASFGQDLDGELYVLSLSGPVYRVVPA